MFAGQLLAMGSENMFYQPHLNWPDPAKHGSRKLHQWVVVLTMFFINKSNIGPYKPPSKIASRWYPVPKCLRKPNSRKGVRAPSQLWIHPCPVLIKKIIEYPGTGRPEQSVLVALNNILAVTFAIGATFPRHGMIS